MSPRCLTPKQFLIVIISYYYTDEKAFASKKHLVPCFHLREQRSYVTESEFLWTESPVPLAVSVMHITEIIILLS